MKIWLSIVLLLLALLILGFLPQKKTKNIIINAEYFSVYRYLTVPENWCLWQPELKASATRGTLKNTGDPLSFTIRIPEATLVIKKVWLNNLQVTETRDGKVSVFNYIIAPELKTNYTTIIIVYQQNTWAALYHIFFPDSVREGLIAQLKKHMENVNSFYGFDIQKKITSPDNFIVNKKKISKKEIYRCSNFMLRQLNNFVSVNKLVSISPFLLQYYDAGRDSVQLLIGLQVNKKTAKAGKLEYMNMHGSKVLTVNFNGRYLDRIKVYRAVQRYMTDNFFKTTISPFEEFSNGKLPASDTSIVNMQVIFPYFKN